VALEGGRPRRGGARRGARRTRILRAGLARGEAGRRRHSRNVESRLSREQVGGIVAAGRHHAESVGSGRDRHRSFRVAPELRAWGCPRRRRVPGHRSVRGRGHPGRRRNGRRLPGPRPRAWWARRVEDDPPREPGGDPRVQARVPHAGRVRPPERGRPPRAGPGRRHVVLHDGARRGDEPPRIRVARPQPGAPRQDRRDRSHAGRADVARVWQRRSVRAPRRARREVVCRPPRRWTRPASATRSGSSPTGSRPSTTAASSIATSSRRTCSARPVGGSWSSTSGSRWPRGTTPWGAAIVAPAGPRPTWRPNKPRCSRSAHRPIGTRSGRCSTRP
jgi:hypothetical protein